MRCVFQADTFAGAGNGTIKFLKQRHKLRDKLGTFGTNILRFGGHLLVVNIQHLGIGLFVAFQQRIAVLQRLVVPDERRQIGLVVLRNGHIQKSATRIATFVYQIQVGRRHQHHRQQPDMVRQTFVLLLIAPETFFCTAFHRTRHHFGDTLTFKLALNHKKIGIVFDDLRIDRIEMALAKRQIINNIQ